MWMLGQGLSLFAKASVNSRLGALCTVPSPGIDQSQSQRLIQSQHIVGPLGESKEGSQQTNRLGASARRGVAKRRRRQSKASPRRGVAKRRRR